MTENLAARSAHANQNDHEFQQNCVTQLTEFNTNVLGFQSVLGELSSGKGLAFYDHTNDLEKLLKNLVNANKSALDAVSKIVNDLPILGPILGPSKCCELERIIF
jgi:ferritin-like protein